ncbi:MAG: hypothetical protein ACLQU4_00600 [Limisphaerales bacterium]
MTNSLQICAGSAAPDASAGSLPTVFGQPSIPVPDDLRREILEARARIVNQKPATLRDADPALISIYFHWTDEINRLTKAALAPLSRQGIEIHPTTVKCQAAFIAEFVVRDFPTWQPATPANIALLFSIFDRALLGQVNLFADAPADVPPCLPRRWSMRWLKNLLKNPFRARLHSLAGGDTNGGPGRVSVIVDACPVRPSFSTASTQQGAGDNDSEPFCNPT